MIRRFPHARFLGAWMSYSDRLARRYTASAVRSSSVAARRNPPSRRQASTSKRGQPGFSMSTISAVLPLQCLSSVGIRVLGEE